MSPGILYISYDGMLEPLGQSQVIAYLEQLGADRPIHLVSFEKPKDWADDYGRGVVASRLVSAGIRWHPRRYHKRPSALATVWDVVVGTLTGLWLVVRYRLRIVHARSYVPSVMALLIAAVTGARYLFDMRGFWAEERVDGGLWPPDGRMYRVAKWFERRFLLNADHVVSLTNAALTEIRGFDYLQGRMPAASVIPTCADLERFRRIDGARDATAFTLGYVGSAGTWYLFDAVARAMRMLLELRPDARFLLLNRGEHAYILERLTKAGVPESRIEIRAVDHSRVAEQMARMDAGIFFIKPVFSKQASAPTRLGEFLGCGVPCLSNAGVGDMAQILRSEGVGVAVDTLEEAALQQGLADLLKMCAEFDIRERCVASARRHFSLEDGVARYRAVYEAIG